MSNLKSLWSCSGGLIGDGQPEFKAPQQQSKDRRLEMAGRSGKETLCLSEQAATCKGAA